MQYPQRRRPTVADVAQSAQVSVATAGRALGGYGYVGEETKARVKAAADRLGYTPNVVARSMRSGGTRSIGFVGSDISNPFFAEAMRGICDVADSHGYETILTNSDERADRERLAVRTLLEKQIDGMIVVPASVTDITHLLAARDQGVPVVLLDRTPPGAAFDSVTVDNEQAALEAVAHLAQLGHRRIGLLATVNPSEQPDVTTSRLEGATVRGVGRPSVDRVRGYLRALNKFGVRATLRLMRYSPPGADAINQQANLLLATAPRPTAVFTADNAATRGLFLAVRRLELHIPNDLSIIGFDDLDWTVMVDPPLSVVAQSPLGMGRAAAERLFARIDGNNGPADRVVLPTELRLRASTAPPPRTHARKGWNG